MVGAQLELWRLGGIYRAPFSLSPLSRLRPRSPAELLLSRPQLLSFAFPVVYAIPLFDIFGPHLAHDWLWWFSPSFSYIGQGIIMGFPTTASMNLVRFLPSTLSQYLKD